MIFLFLVSAFSFPLKGIWNVTMTSNKGEEENFRLRISTKNTTFVGQIRTEESHKMIPKKIHIKELVPDKRYILIIPYTNNPRFCEFWFSNETGTLISNANSTDNNWNVTARIVPGEKMEIELQKYGRNNFYKFSAIPFEKPSSVKLIIEYSVVVIVVIVAIVAFVIVKHVTNIKKKHVTNIKKKHD